MQLGEVKSQPNGFQFSTMDSKIALQDLELNQNDDDGSNTSDKSFVPEKENKMEFNDELKLDRGPSDENQEDHFRTTSQRELGKDSVSNRSLDSEDDNSTSSTGSILNHYTLNSGVESIDVSHININKRKF